MVHWLTQFWNSSAGSDGHMEMQTWQQIINVNMTYYANVGSDRSSSCWPALNLHISESFRALFQLFRPHIPLLTIFQHALISLLYFVGQSESKILRLFNIILCWPAGSPRGSCCFPQLWWGRVEGRGWGVEPRLLGRCSRDIQSRILCFIPLYGSEF